MSELVERINDIALAVVMADMTDLQSLADLKRRFDEISSLASERSLELVSKASMASGKLIEDLIMGEVTDVNQAGDAISQTISIIQSIVLHGSGEDEISFPELIAERFSKDDGTKKIEVHTDVSEPSGIVIADPDLASDFVSESREHLDNAEAQLLTLENDPTNEEALNAVYRAFHTIKGLAGFLGLEAISTLAHATEDLLDSARKGKISFVEKPVDITLSSIDRLRQMISHVESALASGSLTVKDVNVNDLLSSIEEILSSEGEASISVESKEETTVPDHESPERIEVRGTSIPSTEVAIEEVSEPQATTICASTVGDVNSYFGYQERSAEPRIGGVKETLKIDAERLDRLVDMIGELVIAESMVNQDSDILERISARSSQNLSQLAKITRDLQEIGMSLRMMPVRPVFERMARLCRDLARKAGKKIEFTMRGEDTEVDKSVVEKIADPLTHMIRNAVDHGIESSPEERVKAGKPEVGHIELRAYHKGGDIIIEVEDDGRGLNKEKILAKAKERGLVTEDQILSDQEIYNLIFLPGFSTADSITDVSGRGVGMDVVNKNVQALRGQVEIHTTPGKGTTFVMRMPLTLAIMDGIIVQVGSEQYIIPTLSVVESIRPKKTDISTVMGKAEMIMIRGRLLPMFRISNLFGVSGAIEDPTEALVIVVEDEGKQVGFMVDNLVGHQQIVIKSLGGIFDGLVGISGGTIMADGRVGLILDVGGIIRLATNGGFI